GRDPGAVQATARPGELQELVAIAGPRPAQVDLATHLDGARRIIPGRHAPSAARRPRLPTRPASCPPLRAYRETRTHRRCCGFARRPGLSAGLPFLPVPAPAAAGGAPAPDRPADSWRTANGS